MDYLWFGLGTGDWSQASDFFFQFSQGLLTPSYISDPVDSIVDLISEQHTQGKSNNNNEVGIDVMEIKHLLLPYLTCTKIEKNKDKKSMPDKAKKMCYLESSYKECLSKVSSSFTWISHFDFNYKLEVIVTQKCTFSYVFQLETSLGRCEQLSPFGFFKVFQRNK